MDLNFKTTPLLTEYFNLQKKGENKYGENTVVFMEVGSFYEIYEVDCQEGRVGKAKEIAGVLNIQVTRKNKSKDHGPRNPYMMGFPNYAVEKFISRLIQNNYTIIKVNQHDIPNSDSKDRKVDKIYSPATYIDGNVPTTNFLVCIIIEIYKGLRYGYLSAIDLTTGCSQVYDTHDTIQDNNKTENDIFRFIHSLDPSEVLFCCKKDESLISTYQLQNKIVHFREIIYDYRKVSYQNQFLGRIFKNTDILSPIEFIGLSSNPDLVTSFVCLLQFAYEHDHSVINKIQEPEFVSDNEILVLNNDSIYQFNLVSSGNNNKEFSSLLKVVDKTVTNMGKRLLRERLLRPITNVDKIKKRYDYIDRMREGDNVIKFEKILGQISDIEKKHRKVHLQKLTPNEFFMLTFSYENVKKLLDIAPEIFLNKNIDKISHRFNKFYEDYNAIFIMKILEETTSLSSIHRSLFKKGIFKDIDKLENEIEDKHKYFNDFALELSKIADIKNTTSSVKLNSNDKEGYYYTTTTKRAGNIEKSWKGEKLEINTLRNVAKIFSVDIMKKSKELRVLESEICELVKVKYIKIMNKLFAKYDQTFKRIIKLVSELDVICSSTKVANNYAYSRPIIKESKKSFLKYDGLRHPIVERIINCEYQSNNISLGKEKNGMLLYGINSSGKSTLIRAIGSNIVLAQAGMFVACGKLEFSPYNILMSKISCTDNLFRGQSTFVSEMYELRNMLKRASSKALILADELCSGSESLSATSIVASTILSLIKTDSTFLFSTHLHSLIDIKELTELESLSIKHFAVKIEKGNIVYDRELKEGHGDSLYGLEIANSLNLGSDFITKAFEIRSMLEKKENVVLSTKTSRYNKDVYVHECRDCGKQELEAGPLHTHHLSPQKDADRCGVISGKFHKNMTHNLVILCAKCHENIHREMNREKNNRQG